MVCGKIDTVLAWLGNIGSMARGLGSTVWAVDKHRNALITKKLKCCKNMQTGLVKVNMAVVSEG